MNKNRELTYQIVQFCLIIIGSCRVTLSENLFLPDIDHKTVRPTAFRIGPGQAG